MDHGIAIGHGVSACKSPEGRISGVHFTIMVLKANPNGPIAYKKGSLLLFDILGTQKKKRQCLVANNYNCYYYLCRLWFTTRV